MSDKELINRVDREAVEITERRQKLDAFIASEEFNELSEQHRYLLSAQASAMYRYEQILVNRLMLLEKEYRERLAGGAA